MWHNCSLQVFTPNVVDCLIVRGFRSIIFKQIQSYTHEERRFYICAACTSKTVYVTFIIHHSEPVRLFLSWNNLIVCPDIVSWASRCFIIIVQCCRKCAEHYCRSLSLWCNRAYYEWYHSCCKKTRVRGKAHFLFWACTFLLLLQLRFCKQHCSGNGFILCFC